MAEDLIWNLIAKKLSGEASEEELKELEKTLRDNPELHYPVQTIIDLWMTDLQFDTGVAHEAFKRHMGRMRDLNIEFGDQQEEESTPKAVWFKRQIILWPTLTAIILLGALFLRVRFTAIQDTPPPNPTRQAEIPVNQISTKNGYKTNLLLPDGTKVWLNAGTRLTYDSSYGKNIREVVLSGEAFFDVVKNKAKPFIIHASQINIKVLGTQFNVKSYPTDRTTETSLIRGSIEVTFKDKPSKKIILKPNEKLVVDNEGILKDILATSSHKNHEKINEGGIRKLKLTYEHKTGAVIETSWVDNKLIFQDESFEDIAHQLERWYGVSITFNNQQLKENHLTGSFKNETIRQALDALKFTAPFNYGIDNNNNVTIF